MHRTHAGGETAAFGLEGRSGQGRKDGQVRAIEWMHWVWVWGRLRPLTLSKHAHNPSMLTRLSSSLCPPPQVPEDREERGREPGGGHVRRGVQGARQADERDRGTQGIRRRAKTKQGGAACLRLVVVALALSPTTTTNPRTTAHPPGDGGRGHPEHGAARDLPPAGAAAPQHRRVRGVCGLMAL